MARLEDLPRTTPFTTPDGYFDQLPGKIQSRIPTSASRSSSIAVRYMVRLGLPAILLAAAFLYYRSGTSDAETILASVDTQEIINYLQETGMSTDEMLEDVSLTETELEALEGEVYDLGLEDIDGLDLN